MPDLIVIDNLQFGLKMQLGYLHAHFLSSKLNVLEILSRRGGKIKGLLIAPGLCHFHCSIIPIVSAAS
jgi:hypothetical protein